MSAENYCLTAFTTRGRRASPNQLELPTAQLSLVRMDGCLCSRQLAHFFLPRANKYQYSCRNDGVANGLQFCKMKNLGGTA